MVLTFAQCDSNLRLCEKKELKAMLISFYEEKT